MKETICSNDNCRRNLEETWTNCPYCGLKVQPAKTDEEKADEAYENWAESPTAIRNLRGAFAAGYEHARGSK